MTYRIVLDVGLEQRNPLGQLAGTAKVYASLEIEPGVLGSLADILGRLSKILAPGGTDEHEQS